MKAALKGLIGRLRLYPLAAWLYGLWHGGRLLLVQASYRRSLSLPGGGIGRDEPARQAAVRELAEELELRVQPDDLGTAWGVSALSRGGRNTVWIFPLVLHDQTALQPDGLEITACHWLSREQALERQLPTHLRAYLVTAMQPCSRATRTREALR
jgi:8-oxo-dGTP pyrophosphatase MutT (NUDIX family)